MSTTRGRPSLRSLPLPSLGTLKASLEVLKRFGSLAPPLQTAVDISLQIIEYTEHIKKNRHDSLELVRTAAEIVRALADATQGLQEDDMEERFRDEILEFHQQLVEIATTMQRLTRTNVWRRLLNKDADAEAIVKHQRALERATILFHIKDGISKRLVEARHHKEIMSNLHVITVALQAQRTPPSMVTALGTTADCMLDDEYQERSQDEPYITHACTGFFFDSAFPILATFLGAGRESLNIDKLVML